MFNACGIWIFHKLEILKCLYFCDSCMGISQFIFINCSLKRKKTDDANIKKNFDGETFSDPAEPCPYCHCENGLSTCPSAEAKAVRTATHGLFGIIYSFKHMA